MTKVNNITQHYLIDMTLGSQNGVYANYIGVNVKNESTWVCLGNEWGGIYVSGINNHIQDNVICCNHAGIAISGSNAYDNRISMNFVGTNETMSAGLGNELSGIHLFDGARHNMIGPENIIAFNGTKGVEVSGEMTLRNTITRNSIFLNGGKGIDNEYGGNTELPPPVIDGTNPVAGTAQPYCKIEIFSDSGEEGKVYEGTVSSDAAGNWTWSGTASGPNLTATATDTMGNTSEFSEPLITEVNDDNFLLNPNQFHLHQNYPNPFNPTTTIRFDLPEPAKVRLLIYNVNGKLVRELLNTRKHAGSHYVNWDGRDESGKTVSSGIYFYSLEANGLGEGNRSFTDSKKLIFMK